MKLKCIFVCRVLTVFVCLFSQVFSVKSIHLLEKKMLWLNGRLILPTLHGWKVRNDIHNNCTSSRDACIISMERTLLLFQFSVLASAHTVHAFRALLSFFFLFFWHHWIPRHFLPCSFEEADPCVCCFFLDLFYIASCLLCEQPTVAIWCEKSFIVNGSLCASDPDEVIYDDVPRENSDSNTGLWNFFFHHYISQIQYFSSRLLLWACQRCSLSLLLA